MPQIGSREKSLQDPNSMRKKPKCTSQTPISPEPNSPPEIFLEPIPLEPLIPEEVQDSKAEEEFIEPDAGELLEREWRAKGERFILDHYPELAKFSNIQNLFFQLRTIIFIVKQPLSSMLKIAQFRGVEFWEEKVEAMNVFSGLRKTVVRIKPTSLMP